MPQTLCKTIKFPRCYHIQEKYTCGERKLAFAKCYQ